MYSLNKMSETESIKQVPLNEQLEALFERTQSWSRENKIVAKHLKNHLMRVARGLGAPDDDPLMGIVLNTLKDNYLDSEDVFEQKSMKASTDRPAWLGGRRTTAANMGYRLVMEDALGEMRRSHPGAYEVFNKKPWVEPMSEGTVGGYAYGLRLKNHWKGIFYSKPGGGSQNYTLHTRPPIMPQWLWEPAAAKSNR